MGNQSIVTLPPGPKSIVKRDRYWPPRDRLDRKIPHRGESIGWLRAVPGMINFFERTVPDAFWTEGVDADGLIVTVACRCGEEPVLHWGLRSYSIVECPCGRFFMHDGRDVRVGYDLDKVQPDPEPPEEPEPEVEPPVPPEGLAEPAAGEPEPDS